MSGEEARKVLHKELHSEFPFLGEDIPDAMLESILEMRAGGNPFLGYPAVETSGFSGNLSKLGPLFVRYKGDHVILGSAIHVKDYWETFDISQDDVLIIGAWKTGTSWLGEVVYCILHPDYDPKDASRGNTNVRLPNLDMFWRLKVIGAMPPPRSLKSHFHLNAMPPSLLQAKPKIIYIYRNPRDTCVSMYHYCRMFKPLSYTGSFDDFFELFVKGTVPSGPYMTHIKSFWTERASLDIMFVAYEDLHKHFAREVTRMATFLGKEVSHQQIDTMERNLSFSSMKETPSMDHTWMDKQGLRNQGETQFLRKGVVGDWMNYMTPEQVHRMDAMVEKEMAAVDIQFCYSL